MPKIQMSSTAQAQIAAGKWTVPLANLVTVLTMIPWAEEFQELDKASVSVSR